MVDEHFLFATCFLAFRNGSNNFGILGGGAAISLSTPVNLLFLVIAISGMSYNGRSSLNVDLNRLISRRQSSLTIMLLGSNEVKYTPSIVRTCESATYAIPGLNTLSDKSIITRSSESP